MGGRGGAGEGGGKVVRAVGEGCVETGAAVVPLPKSDAVTEVAPSSRPP